MMSMYKCNEPTLLDQKLRERPVRPQETQETQYKGGVLATFDSRQLGQRDSYSELTVTTNMSSARQKRASTPRFYILRRQTGLRFPPVH